MKSKNMALLECYKLMDQERMVAVGRTPGLPRAIEPAGVRLGINEIFKHAAHGIEDNLAEIDGDDLVLADLGRRRLAGSRGRNGLWQVPEIEFATGGGLVGSLQEKAIINRVRRSISGGKGAVENVPAVLVHRGIDAERLDRRYQQGQAGKYYGK